MAWAELTDVRFYYELLGQGDPLLLIPGLGVTSRVWDPVVPELAEHFSVILVDNRGVGQSKGKRPPLSLSDFCSDLIELLDLLQVERTHVMGLSLGGVIAHRFAQDHPGRVDRLVLASCTDKFTPYLRHVAQMLGQTLRRLRSRAFAETVEILGTSPQFLDAAPHLVEERVNEKCAQGIPARAVGQQLRCLARSDSENRQEPILAPTLVVAGEHDFLIPNCYAREMASRIPGSRFVMVPGAGHNPLVECPDTVVPGIIDFLQGREPWSAGPPARVSNNHMGMAPRLESVVAGGKAL